VCTVEKTGVANPCNGWWLDPVFTMISAASDTEGENVTVESTLMDEDCCGDGTPMR